MLGSEGTGDGQFYIGCFAVAISPDSKLWVSDRGRVQVFTLEGKFLFQAGKGQLEEPRGIALILTGSVHHLAPSRALMPTLVVRSI